MHILFQIFYAQIQPDKFNLIELGLINKIIKCSVVDISISRD